VKIQAGHPGLVFLAPTLSNVKKLLSRFPGLELGTCGWNDFEASKNGIVQKGDG